MPKKTSCGIPSMDDSAKRFRCSSGFSEENPTSLTIPTPRCGHQRNQGPQAAVPLP